MTNLPGRRIVALTTLISAAVCAAAEPVPDCAPFLSQFDKMTAAELDDALAKPLTNDQGQIAWGHAYTLAGLAEMLNTTGDAKCADQFVKLADWVISARDDRHGRRDVFRDRAVKAWGSAKYSDGKWYVWAVHTGMVVAPMAQFAAVVGRNPALAKKYGNDADRFVKVAQEAVASHADQYREGPGRDEGHLYGIYLKKHLPLNMQNALARAWIYLDDATGTKTHRERITRLARFLRNRLRATDDGAYVWSYWPPLEGLDTSFEDISHASINVDFMVLCYEHGIVFTREDIVRVEKTLLTRVLLPDGSAANTVGGTGGTNKYTKAVSCWGRLANHGEGARKRLLSFCRSANGAADSSEGLALMVAACRSATTQRTKMKPAG